MTRDQRHHTPTCRLLVTALLASWSLAQLLNDCLADTTADENDQSKVIARGIDHILATQEGDRKAEWPYEGVYRVGGAIPIGYRVGGTSICAMALLSAPDYSQDPQRRDAVGRAARFVIDSIDHPLMAPDYDGGYDVRGWGYTYGLAFLLKCRNSEALAEDLRDPAEKTIRFLVDAIQKTEIHTVGGWNYARGQGAKAVSPPSPFMTAPTLQALFEAKKLGFAVDADIVERGLGALERARTPSGAFCYSGDAGKNSRDAVPGATGRMLASETTLFLAGRSSVANVRGAIDAFLVHWQWLEKRRRQPGTHAPPYAIAPYYFFYAHYYAAQAIELLPEHERGEYRRRLTELIMSVRSPEGSWNDRVFERSSNYGTAMSVMAILMPQLPTPARWN